MEESIKEGMPVLLETLLKGMYKPRELGNEWAWLCYTATSCLG